MKKVLKYSLFAVFTVGFGFLLMLEPDNSYFYKMGELVQKKHQTAEKKASKKYNSQHSLDLEKRRPKFVPKG